MKRLRLLLVDDHAVVREGVRRLLLDAGGIDIDEAASGQQALELSARERYDVVILDLNLEGLGGFELLSRLLKDVRQRIIVFSMHGEPLYAARAMRLGAKGYVSKSAAADELVAAVRRVADGGTYVERELANQLASGVIARGGDPLQQLTTREIEILRLLGDGRSMSDIAAALRVSYKTVANTCSIMKSKLGLERTADLIRTSFDVFER